MSIKLTKDNIQRRDLFIALWPPTKPPEPPAFTGLDKRWHAEDFAWLDSDPKHIILGIIRDGLFHNVEDG